MPDIVNIKKIIIANWKLHGSIEFANDYLKNIDFDRSKNAKSLVVCAPITLIPYLNSDKFYLGAQDCSSFNEGAYTGEISSKLLKEIGCDFIIVGHSERRNIFNENSKSILIKIKNIIKNGIVPIICIGENLQQRKENLTKDILKDQLINSLPKEININKIIIAYEPIWSIGTGLIPTTEEISEIHTFIKGKIFNNKNIKVIYGGSVKAANYKKIIDMPNVDGLLVGGASINLDEFNQIIKF
tara:strand:+ start:600 stop:1325 length:726 start_codon:yes stop_codon:yes gene_type:complete